MKEIRLLFTGVGRRVELLQAFRQAALTQDIKIKIYGAEMTESAPALAYCDAFRKVCRMKDPAYIGELTEICKRDRIHILIPTIDTDLLVLSENRERFEQIGTKVLISSPDMIRICRDKMLTAGFFEAVGLKAPGTVRNWQEYQGGYPAFIKPKDGSSSINAFMAGNLDELKRYADRIGDCIIQPYIEGIEFTVDIFCSFEGDPISIVPRIRRQIRAGEVLKTEICMDKRIIMEAESICRTFKPCGPLTVQLIREKTSHEDYFIEINPRFGGGSPLSMKAGARTAEVILRQLAGQEVSYYENISDGAVYSRFDQSVCIKGTSEIQGVIFDLDDTLYPEKEYVKSGFKAVARFLGNEKFYDKLWQYFKQGIPAIDALLEELGRMPEKNAALSVYRTHDPEICLFEGAGELMQELRRRGIRTGIITDGRPEGQHRKLNALQMDLLADDIIITDELGGEQFRKPCDIAFRIMQRRWKLPPEEIVYVGDNTLKDFMAPKQLGMQSILFCGGDGLYKSGEDTEAIQTADNYTELAELLFSMLR